MLLELQQSNLLLQAVDSGRQVFRYRTLFAEFLRQQLREQHPDLLPQLARRASEWCLHAGRAESAVEYALLAADQAHLIACVRACVERLITRAQFETAKRWLRAISPELPGWIFTPTNSVRHRSRSMRWPV
jgi:ATP/maltotriose-dependent transcriptional regulator MalT